MHARARVLGHAIHPMLVPFPLGLLSTAAILDLIWLVADSSTIAAASFVAIAAGIVGGLAAGGFGFVDWLATPSGSRARRVGAVHGVGNVVVLVLFAVSWLLRLDVPGYAPSTAAVVLSVAGAAIAGVTGWLGGELVQRLAIGVEEGAHPDAPSSLGGEPLDPRGGDVPRRAGS